MVIIAPAAFSDALQPLITHKNTYGIETTLKTTEDIYAEFDGFDKAEQIKYFIKDALEQWNIKYVLLAGGLTSTVYAKARDNTNIGASGWHSVLFDSLISMKMVIMGSHMISTTQMSIKQGESLRTGIQWKWYSR